MLVRFGPENWRTYKWQTEVLKGMCGRDSNSVLKSHRHEVSEADSGRSESRF